MGHMHATAINDDVLADSHLSLAEDGTCQTTIPKE